MAETGKATNERKAAVWHSVYLHPAYWAFVDQWDGDSPSQKIRHALEDLERFRPDGPAGKQRGPGGRFKHHEPSLLERAARSSLEEGKTYSANASLAPQRVTE